MWGQMVPGFPMVPVGYMPVGMPMMSNLQNPPYDDSQPEIPPGGIVGKNKDQEPLPVEHNKIYNLQQILAENILDSDYYKNLFRKLTVNDVIEEFKRNARNIEPRIPGLSRQASTAFCILFKLFNMRLTQDQATEIVEHEDPLIRGLGFLYLRYILKPTKLWEWLEPHLDDPTEFQPGAQGATITIGKFVRDLLEEQKYFQTTLPRLPKTVHQIFRRELLKRELASKRNQQAEWQREELEAGMKIKALYEDDGKWYDAKVLKILNSGEFSIEYTEYEEKAKLPIGHLKLRKRRRSRSSERDRRDRDRSRKRRRSDSRDRDRDRGRRRRDDRRDRKRRRSKSPGRGKKDPPQEIIPDVLTDDYLDNLIKERDSKKYLSNNSFDVIRPHQAGNPRGSVRFETATLRERTPSPPPMRAPKLIRPSKNEVRAKKPVDFNKRIDRQIQLQQLRTKYGDASANN